MVPKKLDQPQNTNTQNLILFPLARWVLTVGELRQLAALDNR